MASQGTPCGDKKPAREEWESKPEEADDLPPAKNRKVHVTGEYFRLNPHSMIGSWFHRLENDEIVWQGVVVGEPGQGVYLVEVEVLAPGAENVQRLVPLEQMQKDEEGYDWRFYDDKESCVQAYAFWLLCETKRGSMK